MKRKIGIVSLIFVLILGMSSIAFLVGKKEKIEAQGIIRINPGDTRSWQDFHEICRTLINSSSQPAYMVPAKTTTEWIAALKGLHNLGVTLKRCEKWIKNCGCCNCGSYVTTIHHQGPSDIPYVK